MSTQGFDARYGWRLFQYSAFRATYDPLVAAVAALRADDPQSYMSHPKTKLLARINAIILEEVPRNPGDAVYHLGHTLGSHNKNWFRVKFLQLFRLFFRYNSTQRIIVYCWLNDENTLRKQGASSDPYRVFARMLAAGNPPSRWPELLSEVTRPDQP